MFSSSQGLWWSPSGKYLAYIESNDTEVHNIEYSWFGDDQYPSTVSIPYPKVGHPDIAYATPTCLYADYRYCFTPMNCVLYA